MVYAGAENIISPLGNSAAENFEALKQNKSGIKLIPAAGIKDEDIWASAVGNLNQFDLFENCSRSIRTAIEQIDETKFIAGKTLLLISTTKGNIAELKSNNIGGAELLNLGDQLKTAFSEFTEVKIISNACISGVLALVVGHDLISANEYDHVIVCGADMLAEFTIAGFQSFFAIADAPCKPFDKNRTGISLGEAIGTIVLSNDMGLYKESPLKLLGGTEANDANHISGPSRTGEGLYRSIQKTFKVTGVSADEIDFLSAHGTGTAYNDEMESIAFDRAGLIKTPLNSLKGYFGHTFGAAGAIESVICMQSMRNNLLIASAGFEEAGTSIAVNVLSKNEEAEVSTVLKTASGFGGCNASIILQK